MAKAKITSKLKEIKNKESLLKQFDIDFDSVDIKLPDESELHVSITKQLMINQDLPADVLKKMAECAAIYSRWGVISAQLISYKNLLEEEQDIFMKKIKSKARLKLTGRPAEVLVEETAVLDDNMAEYRVFNKKIRKVEKSIYSIKKVMRALEMQSEMARSISSYTKKEMSMTGDPIIGRGSLKS